MIFIFWAWAGLHLRGHYCFCSHNFLSQMFAFFTAWTYPKTHQTWNIYVTPAQKCHKLLSSSISTTRRCYNQEKSVFTCTLSHIQKPYIHTLTELCCFHCMPIYLLFLTPSRRFHRFAFNFAHSICGLSWQKVIKMIFII